MLALRRSHAGSSRGRGTAYRGQARNAGSGDPAYKGGTGWQRFFQKLCVRAVFWLNHGGD
jgi:hypothetical protein